MTTNSRSQRNAPRAAACLAILERAANAGAACPTNAALAQLLGYSSGNGPSGLVNLLEVSGFISVERSNAGRVVTIVKSGKRTAGIVIPRKPSDWTADQDAIMTDALAEGAGFTAIARMLGKTKNACQSRFRKIAAQLGEDVA